MNEDNYDTACFLLYRSSHYIKDDFSDTYSFRASNDVCEIASKCEICDEASPAFAIQIDGFGDDFQYDCIWACKVCHDKMQDEVKKDLSEELLEKFPDAKILS